LRDNAELEFRAAPLALLGHADSFASRSDVYGGAPAATRHDRPRFLFHCLFVLADGRLHGRASAVSALPLGFVFIPVFLAVLYVNVDIRDAREDVSRTRAAVESADVATKRARPSPGVEITRWRAVFVMLEGQRPVQDSPTGAALALKMAADDNAIGEHVVVVILPFA
jgi:hypothetical protein